MERKKQETARRAKPSDDASSAKHFVKALHVTSE